MICLYHKINLVVLFLENYLRYFPNVISKLWVPIGYHLQNAVLVIPILILAMFL